jgi:hypothetical protein
VKQTFRVCAVDSGDEGEELMATVTRLSLRCPLGLTPIETPARGKECKHLQVRGCGGRVGRTLSGKSWTRGCCHHRHERYWRSWIVGIGSDCRMLDVLTCVLGVGCAFV